MFLYRFKSSARLRIVFVAMALQLHDSSLGALTPTPIELCHYLIRCHNLIWFRVCMSAWSSGCNSSYSWIKITFGVILQKNTGQAGGSPGLDLNVEGAWKRGITGKGITTAIMDDGIDYLHPDLYNNFVSGFWLQSSAGLKFHITVKPWTVFLVISIYIHTQDKYNWLEFCLIS